MRPVASSLNVTPPSLHSITASLTFQLLNVPNSLLPQDLCTHHSLCLECFPSRSRHGLSWWVCMAGRTYKCQQTRTVLPCNGTTSLASSHPVRPILQIIHASGPWPRHYPRPRMPVSTLSREQLLLRHFLSPHPPPLMLAFLAFSSKMNPFERCINSPLQASVPESPPSRSFTSQILQPPGPLAGYSPPFAFLYFLLAPAAPRRRLVNVLLSLGSPGGCEPRTTGLHLHPPCTPGPPKQLAVSRR